MDWYKWEPGVIRHPILKRFRAPERVRVLELVALACSWGNVGVIRLYDDEIASELNLSLSDWMARRDRYLLHGVIRQVATPAGRHAYEIAPWLLPQQQNDQRAADCFRPETWENPEQPADAFTDVAARDGAPGVTTGAMTGAERKALYDARLRARQAGLPEPNKDAFLADYRARRAVEDATQNSNGNGPQVSNVSPLSNGNGGSNVTAAQTTEQREERREDNNNAVRNEPRNGNGGNFVTVTGPDTVVVDSSACAVADSEDAFAAFANWEISRHDADLLLNCYGTARCLEKIRHMPYHLKGQRITNVGGFLRTAIEEDYAAPRAYLDDQARSKAAAEKQSRAAAEEEARERKAEAEKAFAAQIEALRTGLSDEEAAWLKSRVLLVLERDSPVLFQKYKRHQESGEPMGVLLRNTLESIEIRVLAERIKETDRYEPLG